MSQYIDGFVLSVPADKIDAYIAVATKAAAIWKEHGALEYRECVGDDLVAYTTFSDSVRRSMNP